jgi:FMN-dependent NADH-azoreductase
MMSKVLQLKTSIFDTQENQGVSSQLGDVVVTRLRDDDAKLELLVRDFSTDPVPYFDNAWLQALSTPPDERSEDQAEKVAYSDALIAEVQAADTIVIGVPMYNFMLPAALKSWTDHIARVGVTFRYTDTGPVGLLSDKKVYVVLSSGGQHAEGVTDFLRPYFRTFLGFLGMKDVEFIVADGLNMGEEPRKEGLHKAHKQIQNLNSNNAIGAAV